MSGVLSVRNALEITPSDLSTKNSYIPPLRLIHLCLQAQELCLIQLPLSILAPREPS